MQNIREQRAPSHELEAETPKDQTHSRALIYTQIKSRYSEEKRSNCPPLIQNRGEKENVCSKCMAAAKQSKLIKKLALNLKKLNEFQKQTQDEIELLTANFSFIIELAIENIMKESSSRIAKILQEKNQIIMKQSTKIHELEDLETLHRWRGPDNSTDILQMEQLKRELTAVKMDNINLKKQNQLIKAYRQRQKNSSASVFSKNSSIQLPVRKMIHPHISHNQLQAGEVDFKVSKQSTMEEMEIQQFQRIREEVKDKHIESLDNLKGKISRLKSQLNRQKM